MVEFISIFIKIGSKMNVLQNKKAKITYSLKNVISRSFLLRCRRTYVLYKNHRLYDKKLLCVTDIFTDLELQNILYFRKQAEKKGLRFSLLDFFPFRTYNETTQLNIFCILMLARFRQKNSKSAFNFLQRGNLF